MSVGSGYGDFSRPPAPPAPAHTGVLQQQGRVQLDADWNTQLLIGQDALRRLARDLLGSGAAPAGDAGYAVRPIVAVALGPSSGVVFDAVRLAGERTLDVVVRVDSPGTLLSCANADNAAGYRLAVDDDGNLVLGWAWERHGERHWSAYAAPTGLASLPWREFVRVTVAFGEHEARLWADGRPVGRTTLHGRRLDADRPLVLGDLDGDGVTSLAGNLRVWSAVVPPGTDSPPAGWWPLDDAQGRLAEDVVGDAPGRLSGSPPAHWQLADLDVEPGRYYVHGVPVQLASATRYSAQPGRPGLRPPTRPGRHLLFLEVWERTVSAVEAPGLREVALGGLDTVVRTDVVAAVRDLPVPDGATGDAGELLRLALDAAAESTTGRLRAAHTGHVVPGNYLYRVEVHRGGDTVDVAAVGSGEVPVHAVDVARRELLVGTGLGELAAGAVVEMVGADSGELVGVHVLADATDTATGARLLLTAEPAELDPSGRYRIRRPGRGPTFKWSRTNGSAVVGVRARPPGSATVDLLPGGVRLAPGDTVEYVDDEVTLTGRVHPLLEVVAVSYDTNQVELAPPPAGGVGTDADRHPFLRRWDQPATGPGTVHGALALEPDRWIELEDGIQVRFDAGRYRTGDYWWVLSRQDLGTVVWPAEHGHPVARPPDGVERLLAPVALLQVGADAVAVHDLRQTFQAGAGGESSPEPPDRRPAEPPEPVTPGAGPPEPAPPAPSEPVPPIPDGGTAVLAPAGAPPPGYRGTGQRLRATTIWTRPRTLVGGRSDVVALHRYDNGLLVVTTHDMWLADEPGAPAQLLTRLPEARTGFACAVVGDAVYVVGGRVTGARRPDGALLCYTVDDDRWTPGPHMPSAVRDAALVVVAGDLHVLGGRGTRCLLPAMSDRHQVYDLAADRWRTAARLPARRYAAAAAVAANSRVHVVGGVGRQWLFFRRPLTDHVVLDASRGRWSVAQPLPEPRAEAAAAVDATGRVVVAGGLVADVRTASVLVHEPHTRAWVRAAALAEDYDHVAATTSGTVVHVAGAAADGAVVAQSLAAPQVFEVCVPAPGRATSPAAR